MRPTYRTAAAALALSLALGLCGGASAQTIVVGGTDNFTTGNIVAGLTTLGKTFTDQSGTMTPSAAGLGAGDFIIIGNDGGIQTLEDYTPFLNAGGHVVVTGGSNTDDYRNWVSLYFNINDTAAGWHTDGDWVIGAANPVTAFLPSTYTFNNNSMTFHMLGIDATPDTAILGANTEPVNVAAIRSFANGGTFEYMALDLGGEYDDPGDQANFVVPFLQGALNPGAAQAVPEPTSLALLGGLAVSGTAFILRRRRA
jgi:hypothetical protein